MTDGKHALPVVARLRFKRPVPPGFSGCEFSGFKLVPDPSGDHQHGDAQLAFRSPARKGAVASYYPEQELELARQLLAFYIDASVRVVEIRADPGPPDEDLPAATLTDSGPGQNYLEGLGPFAERVMSVDVSVGRQLFRAFKVYAFALDFIESDITFAFLLLSVAVECLSSQDRVIPHDELHRDKHKCDRFCRFLTSFFPEQFKSEDEQNRTHLEALLKTVYYRHRSGFVHGGKEVSFASVLADRAQSPYFVHFIDGKEIKTPGVRWFARLVRGAILGYVVALGESQEVRPRNSLIHRLAIEGASIYMKAKRPIEAGQIVTLDDVHVR